MAHRKISLEQLKAILEEHQKWLESSGKEGTRADLSNMDLRKVNLTGKNLSKANLIGADLSIADLTGAILFKTDLTNANLKDTAGLLPKQLAGANLSGAKLAEAISKFEKLADIEETSKNSRKLFIWIILGCIYSGLTIVTISDVRLLVDSTFSPLPIIGTEISIVWFYTAAPIILLGLYFYFHLYLQRLWEQLADLPAIFPDGTPLYKKVYPWLLNCLAQVPLLHLRDNKRPPLYYFQILLCIFLAWCVVPMTLFFFWASYLRRHDWGVTLLLIAILTLSIVTAIFLYCIHSKTIRREVMKPFLYRKALRDIRTYKSGAVVLVIGIIFCVFSLGVIEGVRPYPKKQIEMPLWDEYLSISNLEVKGVRTWVPRMFKSFGYIPFAKLNDVDVSIKPANWTGQKENDVEIVKGARLKGRDLRYAMAVNVFLINADLQETNLQGANLFGADLRGAKLQKADLSKAYLLKADLSGADLFQTDLSNAYLRRADLTEAFLRSADLSKSSLANADLSNANFLGAALQDADLSYAKLQKVNLLYACLAKTHFFSSKLQEADLQYAILRETDLQGANLSNANLRNADIQNANFFAAILDKTDLRGVDLTTAIDLTKEQIECAIIDEETRLPDYLKGPEQSELKNETGKPSLSQTLREILRSAKISFDAKHFYDAARKYKTATSFIPSDMEADESLLKKGWSKIESDSKAACVYYQNFFSRFIKSNNKEILK